MEAFIDGMCAISPQNTFSGETLFQDLMSYDGVRYVMCIEPNYNEFLNPMASRRMSRIIKMGVVSALKSLRSADIKTPDAIISGTGLGCIEDTEKFLASIYTNSEKLLNPTPFIQSTHNTVGAAIALLVKCNGYNNTFSHRGFSFENALLDGLMLLQEGSANNILVGGMDELTMNSFTIKDRLGFWKKDCINNLRLLDSRTIGSLAGEGTAFFVLNCIKTNHSIAKIKSVQTFYKPKSLTDAELKLKSFINETVENSPAIDLILMGMNGDVFTDGIYHNLKDTLFKNTPCIYYKHLCGEYDTSSSFALYLASSIIKEQEVPAVTRLDNKPFNEIKNILIYNHNRDIHHSMILLSSC